MSGLRVVDESTKGEQADHPVVVMFVFVPEVGTFAHRVRLATAKTAIKTWKAEADGDGIVSFEDVDGLPAAYQAGAVATMVVCREGESPTMMASPSVGTINE